jgi:hypothetical protein
MGRQMTEEVTGRAKGGVARAAALTEEQRKAIGRKAAAARWDKAKDVPKSEFPGELKIGDMAFPCSVLSDGTRILTQSDFMSGMGMYYSGWVSKNRPAEDVAADVPLFLAFKALKPYVDRHLGDLQSITVAYRTEAGIIARGIKAEIIPKICDVWLDAEENESLGKRQKQIAQKAKLLMRALAHVGIIALVDEATGYQEVRNKEALRAILDAFLRKELATWAKRFPDEFYEQIYRLRGWQWKGRSKNPPQIVAAYTKDIVYARLAPHILEELEIRNPIEDGRRRAKHHQWLTDDIGHPALAQHLHAVITLMRVSKTWAQFKHMLDVAHPKRGDTLQLPLMADAPPAQSEEKPLAQGRLL